MKNKSIECAACGGIGHIVAICPILRKHVDVYRNMLGYDGQHTWFFLPGNSAKAKAMAKLQQLV